MAETATMTRSDEKKKKSKTSAEPVKSKVQPKTKTKTKVKKDKVARPGKKAARKPEAKTGGKSKKREGFEGLAKLVDHPLVADLLAAGALAAVAAIAEHQVGKRKGETASRMVKTAGKAAAAAMGKKLFGDIGAITTAATAAAKKS